MRTRTRGVIEDAYQGCTPEFKCFFNRRPGKVETTKFYYELWDVFHVEIPRLHRRSPVSAFSVEWYYGPTSKVPILRVRR